MGARESKTSDAPQQQTFESQVVRLFETQRQEYERKLHEVASEAASLQKVLKEAFITEKRLKKEMKKLEEKYKDNSSDANSNISRDSMTSSSISNRRSYQAKMGVSPQKKVPCPHTSQGCKLNIRLADMEIHEKECPFKDHDCPVGTVFGKCKWQGQISELTRHFGVKHPNGFVPEVGSEFRLKYIRGNHRYVRLIGKDCFFVFHAKISETDNKMCMAVQLIGTKESAMKCQYRIQVHNKLDSSRKHTFTDHCCSVNDNIEDIFKNEECTVLSMCYAKSLIYSGALYLKVFIDYPPL